MKEIEKATYNDEFSFIDRFGFKLYTDNMSTGCKAAICVNAFPDVVVDTIECGTNVLEFMIANCNDGHILMSREAMVFSIQCEIDVIIDDRHFDECNDLLEYIHERY